jgi:hypothetical protein
VVLLYHETHFRFNFRNFPRYKRPASVMGKKKGEDEEYGWYNPIGWFGGGDSGSGGGGGGSSSSSKLKVKI